MLLRTAISLLLLTASPLLRAELFEIHYPASKTDGELQIAVTHRLWIPDGAETLRGVIVVQHGCGVGSGRSAESTVYDLHWQELARKWDCALMGPRYHQAEEQDCRLWCDPGNGSDAVFLRALDDFAKRAGRPELAVVPWCLWGHSGGGFWSSLLQMEHPERIAAIWFQSGTAYSRWMSGEMEAPEIPEAAMKIPMIANPGLKEKDHERFKVAYSGSLAMVRDYRTRGAPIAFAPDPKSGHETRDSRYLAIPFFDACLGLRLPEKAGGGTLRDIDMESSVYVPLEEVYDAGADLAPLEKGDRSEQNWLPNEALAVAWAEFVATGGVTDQTPPPAPTDVRVKHGDLTWTARADLESGLQSFVILRGDKEIGKIDPVPSRRGLPLFQGMTYNGTPTDAFRSMSFPLPEPAAGALKGPGYRVITVNTAGLRSDPSSKKK